LYSDFIFKNLTSKIGKFSSIPEARVELSIKLLVNTSQKTVIFTLTDFVKDTNSSCVMLLRSKLQSSDKLGLFTFFN
jgi:hypothetical protein